MKKWLRSNTDSIGFTFLKEELQQSINQNNDFLINGGSLKHISWDEDSVYLVNGDEIIIPEEDLFVFWNYIINFKKEF